MQIFLRIFFRLKNLRENVHPISEKKNLLVLNVKVTTKWESVKVYRPGVIFTPRKWQKDLSTAGKKILKQDQLFIVGQGKQFSCEPRMLSIISWL